MTAPNAQPLCSWSSAPGSKVRLTYRLCILQAVRKGIRLAARRADLHVVKARQHALLSQNSRSYDAHGVALLWIGSVGWQHCMWLFGARVPQHASSADVSDGMVGTVVLEAGPQHL